MPLPLARATPDPPATGPCLAIFDHDGVLVDSLELHQAAWVELGRRTGLPLTSEFIHETFGMTNPTSSNTGLTAIIGLAAALAKNPEELTAAEAAGFEFAVISDHYFPWVDAMGHSPYAWSVLGAAAQVTARLGLMTYVTCPIKRYHPAVVAQKAATIGVLSDGRFTLA